MDPKVVSVKAAMDYIGCKKTKFYELVKTGKIEIKKLGTRTLVVIASLDAFLASLPER